MVPTNDVKTTATITSQLPPGAACYGKHHNRQVLTSVKKSTSFTKTFFSRGTKIHVLFLWWWCIQCIIYTQRYIFQSFKATNTCPQRNECLFQASKLRIGTSMASWSTEGTSRSWSAWTSMTPASRSGVGVRCTSSRPNCLSLRKTFKKVSNDM